LPKREALLGERPNVGPRSPPPKAGAECFVVSLCQEQRIARDGTTEIRFMRIIKELKGKDYQYSMRD